MSVGPMIKQIIADPFACWKILGLKATRYYRLEVWVKILKIKNQLKECTPRPCQMQIHLVQNSTSAKFEKNPKYSLSAKFT